VSLNHNYNGKKDIPRSLKKRNFIETTGSSARREIIPSSVIIPIFLKESSITDLLDMILS